MDIRFWGSSDAIRLDLEDVRSPTMMSSRDGPAKVAGRKRVPHSASFPSPNPASQAQSPPLAASPLHLPSPGRVPSPACSMVPSPHQDYTSHTHHQDPPLSSLHSHHKMPHSSSTFSIKSEHMSSNDLKHLLKQQQSSPSIPDTSCTPTSPYSSTSPYSTPTASTTTTTNGFGSSKRLRGSSGDQGGGGPMDWSMASPSTNSMGSMSPSVMSPASTSSIGTSSPRQGRDDVSSPNSVYGGYDTGNGLAGGSGGGGLLLTDSKKKKGPVSRQQEDLCLVCGDRASGYHYNALTCEGCKGFFRRSITKKAVYTCKYGGDCEMDMYMRRKCQECRFKKCIDMGMREDCVIPEVKCRIKREQKKARETTKKSSDLPSPGADSSSSCIPSPSPMAMSPTAQMSPESKYYHDRNLAIVTTLNEPVQEKNDVYINPEDLFAEITDHPSPRRKGTLSYLSDLQTLVINKLLYTQESYEIPTTENILPSALDPTVKIPYAEIKNGEMRLNHFTDMTIMTVQLIVESAKRLPGFELLQQNDMITLLKEASAEIMMLRAARRYDATTNSIVFGNNCPYKPEAYELAGMMKDVTDSLFKFCQDLSKMRMDNAEYALLSAITLFSVRCRLGDPIKVERIQDFYVVTLKNYEDSKFGMSKEASIRFAKLLGVLTELRTLGHMNSEQCCRISTNKNSIHPFLKEMWDL